MDAARAAAHRERPAGGHNLAIIVVSWNVRDLLAQCLTSIFDELARTPDTSATIWVVDNASNDDSVEMVTSQFPEVRVIANASNLGFAAANNQALRAAGFESDMPAEELPDYVLLLNPDTTLLPGALHNWLDIASQCTHAGVIGGALQYPDGSFQHSAFEFPTLKQIFFDFFPLHHRLTNSRLNGRYPCVCYATGRPFVVDHPLGAAMLVYRQAILDTGLLDEGYFIYAEEVDWCIRMKAAGWLSVCAPTVRVVHHEAQSTRQVHSPMFVKLWESRLRLFALHYGIRFNWGARRLVQLGLRQRRKEALRQRAIGKIDADTLTQRLNTLDQVAELLQRPKESFQH